MQPETFARLEELFHRASALQGPNRQAFLDRECQDDESLRRQIEALLNAETTKVEGIQESIQQGLQWMATAPQPKHIGPYRVLRELGRGGFSTVYLARRDDGHFDMQVAIKRVHRHLRSPEVLRRLRRERQILALLDHPNIGRIFDGGSTEDGTPYVVMEYIVGEPIDQYCRHHDLDMADRLRLFRQVCEAVQYAHRNLVLHRDLKPSNILVNRTGAVKLVDFGIAKLLQENGEGKGEGKEEGEVEKEEGSASPSPDLVGILTQPGGRALTPEYASPEQVLGSPLTTATDVYSLGVVLYGLVCGQRPYAFQEANWSHLEQVVSQSIPLPPSQVLASAGSPRGSYLGELDAILAKTLNKEPDRRYASVEALEEDLRRTLEGLPIEAHPDSFTYRARKFVARHATAVGTLALLFATLVVAVVITQWQAREAHQARQQAEQQKVRAEHESKRAEQVALFLEELFEDTDPYANQGRQLTAREVLERGSLRIRRELHHDQPLSAELMATLGRVYRRMSLYDESEDLLQMALETHRRREGPRTEREGETLRDLGILFSDRGLCEKAEETFQSAADLQRELGEKHQGGLATTFHYMGRNAMKCDEAQRAEDLILRSLELYEGYLEADAEKVVDSKSLLAELWFSQGDYGRAGPAFQQILELRRTFLGEDHPKVAISLSDVAAVHQANGETATAIRFYTQALEVQRRGLGDRHFSVAQTQYNLATAHGNLGQWEEAQNLLQESITITRQVFGDEHPWVADCLQELGHGYRYLGDLEAAEASFRQSFELRRRLLGEKHPLVAQSLLSLAALTAKQDPERGLNLYREILASQEQTLAPDDFRLSYTLTRLGRLLVRLERPKLATPYLRRALTLRRQGLSEDHWETGLSEYYLGQCLRKLVPANREDLEEAQRLLQSSYDHLRSALGSEDRRTQRAEKALRELASSKR
ncbi:MAG: serine/threonine-protein kinase [Deltaproteobacteria bacterium]|nr:serine/threonine-protein kinase [Deltaproteobacteria bacterium]